MPDISADEIYEYWSEDSSDRRYYAHYREALGYPVWACLGKDAMERIRSFVDVERTMFVLDYGCGGGAITAALLTHKPLIVHAVDICEEALETTRAVAVELNAEYRLLTSLLQSRSIAVDLEAARPRSGYDLIVSTAVFQHFPSKEYASRVLNAFGRIASKKTRAVIQIRHDNGDPRFVQKAGDYASQAITYTSHTHEDFAQRVAEAGWHIARYELPTKGSMGNHAWYYLE